MSQTYDSTHRAADVAVLAAPRFTWWREVIYVLVFYFIYSYIRNQFGSEAVSSTLAFDHAERVIDIEKDLHLYFEAGLQELFIEWRPFLWFWNVFYGTFHFVVTLFVLIRTFLRFPDRWRLARNSILVTTALALIGFASYPLMPPRLLPSSFGFVDTVAEIGGLWSFDSGAMQEVSNQYAAMPSLHFGWALWCLLILYPTIRSRWGRVLIALYPVATLFAIVVTANHYWLDAAGGALVCLIGYWAGSAIARATVRWRAAAAPRVP